MWGEFEDEQPDQISSHVKALPPPDSSCEPTKIVSHSTTGEDDDLYALPLRDRVVHCISASNAEVKSQQKYEPDLTYEERKEIVEKLLKEKPGQFIYRFGKYLEKEHLQYFLEFEGDAEVDYFLAEALKNKNQHTAKITIRNRRYAALQKMRRSGNYFSEEEMERRDPLLYDQLIGQHQTAEERDEKYSSRAADTKFSSILLHHMDNSAHKQLKKQQEEQEDDMFEEEDTDEEEEEEGEDAEMEPVIESREKQMFKEEFFSSGYSAFLRGQNPDFDYQEVDENDAFDLLDIQARDEEERYFDEDEDSCHDMDEEKEKT